MSKIINGYLEKFLIHTRGSLIWSSLLTILFFVIYMPVLPVADYWVSFKVCIAYSGSVFFYVTAVYGLTYLWLALQKRKYKVEQTISYPVHFVISSVAAVLGVVQGTYLKSVLLHYTPQYEEFVFSSLTGCFIALMFIFRALYKEAKSKNLKLKSANIESELHALKNQMQPHFLFNSLNSLLSLIETDNKDASIVAQRLSDLYRDILINSNKNVASLKSELEIIDKYLSMEKLRFGERLEYKILAPKDAENIFIPPLILQTLVENAIKHGITKSIKKGHIDVSILKKNLGYQVQINNSGELHSKSIDSGIGIKNTKSRLEFLYGENTHFTLSQAGSSVCADFWFSGEMIT
jgi:hypothetical protein